MCNFWRSYTRTRNHLVRKRTLNHLVKLAKWLSCVLSTYLCIGFDCMFLSYHVRVSVFVFELSGAGFESSCSHFNFRFRACFEQGVPWHSGNYRGWIHSDTCTWHDKNIQSLDLLCLYDIFCKNFAGGEVD